ncbi:MAG: site-specific integrase [Chloroflexi bacterium]|nr:site-specific integrase [Chloroflexota bacterium]
MPGQSKGSTSYGTGTVYQRKDGRWVAALSLAGRPITRYAKTEKEAKAKLADLQREHYTGTLTAPTRMTLGEWLAEWLEQCETNLRPSTLRCYRQVLAPLFPLMGHIRLDRLTPATISSALSDLRRKGKGTRQVQLAHTYLHAAFQRAADLGMVGHNPVAKVPRPKHEPTERQYWDADQMRAFLNTALTSPYQHAPLLAFLLGTGLRFGEALGLRWADVDLSRGVVVVRRAIVWAGTQATVQRPKTKAGERAVTLPGFILTLLCRMPRPIDLNAPVFVTETSTTPLPGTVRKTLQRLCKEAGVPFLNVHGLRHCHAALLLAEGLDLQALRRRLGHATVDLSVNRYAYALRPDGEAAKAVDRALSHSE